MWKGKKQAKPKEKLEDVLMKERPDRRLLPHVPGRQRSGHSRRALPDEEVAKYGYLKFANGEDANARYLVDYDVHITTGNLGLGHTCKGKAKDLSVTGMGLTVDADDARAIVDSGSLTLSFEIRPGTMPEGLEMKVKTQAKCVRPSKDDLEQQLAEQASRGESKPVFLGVQFNENLLEYSRRHSSRFAVPFVSFLLFVICLCIVLMRTESVVYFKFNKYLYLYSIIASTFLLIKYIFGALYRPVKIDANYTPGVTILVPCFNEETWIRRTILNAMDQFYPPDKLEVIVIDDCSTDHSVERIRETIEEIQTKEGPETAERIHYIVQPVNQGKREALVAGAKEAKHELVLFVDSDSFLNPYAIRNIVQPFKDARCGGVSGRTDVANTYTNSLTKMQSVRYYIAFRIMKAAEGLFDAVTCLSGPLSCYRKDLVLRYADDWLNQRFLGHKATFGDDRAMTNFILRHHRTDYQDTAICYTIVPNDYDVFLKQQMRWKRSWLRESLVASTFMWRKEPFMSVMFYMGVLVPIIAPFIVCYNLIYIPIMHRVFPFTFIFGMFLMAGLMSACQLFLRRSTTWLYGIWFCLYYEMVLLWQMPIAWFTFWKSTWGTRMTPADVAEAAKKAGKKAVSQEAAPVLEPESASLLGPKPEDMSQAKPETTTATPEPSAHQSVVEPSVNSAPAPAKENVPASEPVRKAKLKGKGKPKVMTDFGMPMASFVPQSKQKFPVEDLQQQLASLQQLVRQQQAEIAAQQQRFEVQQQQVEAQQQELNRQKIAAVRREAEDARRQAESAMRQADILKEQAELLEKLEKQRKGDDDHAV
ncbi:glycosyltransferase [uncultured Megasphaera sp.]|uniref:glycosyltransferase family 2 protein n=2 Tax=Megasphaera TaxID=906 RepID=UPI0026277C01|nr:glycosyltransferase [uncultured Megasphaera sp.]